MSVYCDVSSRKGNFLRAGKNKKQNNVSWRPFTNHSCYRASKVESDTNSDDSVMN